MITYHPLGRVVRSRFLLVDGTGAGATGLSPTVAIKRRSDGLYWNGTTFVSGIQNLAMTQEDAINLPGTYFYDFNQATAGGSPEEYLFRYASLSGSVQGIDEEQLVFVQYASSLSPDLRPGHALADDGVTFRAAIWVESAGVRLTNVTSMSAQLKDASSVLLADLGTVAADTSDGIFDFSTPAAIIPRNVPLVITVQATIATVIYSFNLGLVRV